jgi:hypothetical protein
MATPEPSNVAPWYLRNINQALELNEATGQVFVRTGFEGNIIISGNVVIPGNVDCHISEIGTSGNLTVPWMPVSIDGNSSVSISGGNVNAAVTGTVAVSSINSNVTIVDGGGSITIDGNVGVTGNVNIGTMPNVNANITGGNVTVSQGTNPWVVSGNVNATLPSNSNVIISGFSGATSDAFGRLRVSEPFTLFDTNSRYYDHGQFDSSTSGTANVVYVANQSSFQLNVGNTSGDSVIRETKRVFPYQPGKSQLTLNTFCMATPKTNLRQRVGLFGANDGVFFENDGTYNYMVIRSGSTGVEERVRQDAWNGDRLNGASGANNPSGITLNPALTQIFWADVEWLGVGTVRVGFIINGTYYICHSFNHANQAGNTKVYMTTASLPIRYEITNTGGTTGASMMTQICSTVISEGGYTNYGVTDAAGTGITAKRLTNQDTFYPIVSIRLAPGRKDSIVVPSQVDFLSTSVNYYQFKLLLNATLTGATWTGTSETGSVQYDLGATAVTGGTQIQSGFVSARSEVELSALSFFQYQLGRTIAGVSDTITLVMASTSPNADTLAQIGWQELT